MRFEGLPDVNGVSFVPIAAGDFSQAPAGAALDFLHERSAVASLPGPAAGPNGTRESEVVQICGAIAASQRNWFLAVRQGEVIGPELLKVLSTARQSVVVGVRRRHRLGGHSEVIPVAGGIVTSRAEPSPLGHADLVFAGAMSFPVHVHQAILRMAEENPCLTWAQLITSLSAKYLIRTATGTNAHSIGGGSFARAKIVSTFRKEARGRGKAKLRDEIAFLERLPDELRDVYPRVLRCDEPDSESLSMEQEFVNWPTVRAHILREGTDLHEIIHRLRSLLHFLKRPCYENAVQLPPADYIDRLHFRRVRDRIAMTCELYPRFGALVAAKDVILNGTRYANIPEMLDRLENSSALRGIATPPHVAPYVHGDLHFENILLDPASLDFKLVDPRGYELCDVYYDLGKLSHSTNGKYDLLHEGRFVLACVAEGERVHANLHFPDRPLFEAYEQINMHLRRWCFELTGDECAIGRMLFNEAMHFAADMPFHLVNDGVEQRAVAIYLTGVKLLNQFVADWSY